MAPSIAAPLPSDRSFGFTFTTVFALLSAWMAWKSNTHFVVPLAASVLLLLASLTVPRVLHPLNVAWMRLAVLLNRVVSPVVMGVIYFAFLTPIAVAMRLRGRDELRRQFDPGLSTYWIKRDPPGPAGSTFPRQF
ncbi:MAG: hypothetical protein H6Q05_5094 [Acidobacteria bacterium]|nr:hypothetical protein [Acidobacteriota bacterium]